MMLSKPRTTSYVLIGVIAMSVATWILSCRPEEQEKIGDSPAAAKPPQDTLSREKQAADILPAGDGPIHLPFPHFFKVEWRNTEGDAAESYNAAVERYRARGKCDRKVLQSLVDGGKRQSGDLAEFPSELSNNVFIDIATDFFENQDSLCRGKTMSAECLAVTESIGVLGWRLLTDASLEFGLRKAGFSLLGGALLDLRIKYHGQRELEIVDEIKEYDLQALQVFHSLGK